MLLKICSNPPRRKISALMSIGVIAFLILVNFFWNQIYWRSFIELSFQYIFSVCLVFLALFSLYFNVLIKDCFYIHNVEDEFFLLSKNKLLIGRVYSISKAEPAIYKTLDWHLAFWGFGDHKFVFKTSVGDIPFGRGISDLQSRYFLSKISKLIPYEEE